MLKLRHLWIATFIILYGLSEAKSDIVVVCGNTWQIQEREFARFSNPVIGFTVTDWSGAGIHWYVAEEEVAEHLNFKAFFAYESDLSTYAYIDGLEIGERFVTPVAEWWDLEFFDEEFFWPTMSDAFMELSIYAPRCTTQQIESRNSAALFIYLRPWHRKARQSLSR